MPARSASSSLVPTRGAAYQSRRTMKSRRGPPRNRAIGTSQASSVKPCQGGDHTICCPQRSTKYWTTCCSDLPDCSCWRMTPRISCARCDGESATDSPWQMGHFNCDATSCTRWSSVSLAPRRAVLRIINDQMAPITATRASTRKSERFCFMRWAPPRRLYLVCEIGEPYSLCFYFLLTSPPHGRPQGSPPHSAPPPPLRNDPHLWNDRHFLYSPEQHPRHMSLLQES